MYLTYNLVVIQVIEYLDIIEVIEVIVFIGNLEVIVFIDLTFLTLG